jgi:hypothetical protein
MKCSYYTVLSVGRNVGYGEYLTRYCTDLRTPTGEEEAINWRILSMSVFSASTVEAAN